jgi:hypothetical protein
MSEKKAYYTDDELVQQVIDLDAVKTVMAKHAYLLSGGQRRRELEELWVKLPQNRRTASLGLNTGFYVGFDEISNYYVVQNNDIRYENLRAYSEANPEIACNNLNLGLGELIIHSANTPVIYVSDDGRTAKYLAFDFGLYTTGKPDGDCDAYLTSGNVYCELLKENGQWKIWHLVMQHDASVPVGADYGETVPVNLRPGDDPIADQFGEPTIRRNVYDPMFGWEHLYQDMPMAYYSYNAMHSYGPEGDMGMTYYERERRY